MSLLNVWHRWNKIKFVCQMLLALLSWKVCGFKWLLFYNSPGTTCKINYRHAYTKILFQVSSFIVVRNGTYPRTWRCHQVETFSVLLCPCAGNSPVTGEFPSQRPMTWSFDAFFVLRLNKWLSKQSRRRWLETPSRSLCRHCIEMCTNTPMVSSSSWETLGLLILLA